MSAPSAAAPQQAAASAPAPLVQPPVGTVQSAGEPPTAFVSSQPPIATPTAAVAGVAAATAAYPVANQYPVADPVPNPADSTPTSLSSTALGTGPFALQRHEPENKSPNTPLEWIAFVLAFILPPIGIIVAIVALVIGSRTRGFGSTVARVAIVIGVVFSLIAGAGVVVASKLGSDAAAHDSVVASSQAWCTKLQSNPTTLASDTFDWPAPADTIPDSIAAMQDYADYWGSLAKIAPKGIKTGTAQIQTAAKSIIETVTKTQTLDDATNISNMQVAVSSSGVNTWASEYCK
jgi:hypothetical protein